MPRGALIIFEGCDKSGKSTQCRKLVEFLTQQGKKAELWRFPERSTDIGQVINNYIAKKTELDDRAVHLLFSANRWELVPTMKLKLMSGTTLIIDRYAYSGVAFTSAKGLDMEWCKSCDRGLPQPDCVFYMNISVNEAAGRGDFGGERYEVSSFQEKVQNLFFQLQDHTWKIMDACLPIEELHKSLSEQVLQIMDKTRDKALEDTLFTQPSINGISNSH